MNLNTAFCHNVFLSFDLQKTRLIELKEAQVPTRLPSTCFFSSGKRSNPTANG